MGLIGFHCVCIHSDLYFRQSRRCRGRACKRYQNDSDDNKSATVDGRTFATATTCLARVAHAANNANATVDSKPLAPNARDTKTTLMTHNSRRLTEESSQQQQHVWRVSNTQQIMRMQLSIQNPLPRSTTLEDVCCRRRCVIYVFRATPRLDRFHSHNIETMG